jgi:uncharacterized protein YciI
MSATREQCWIVRGLEVEPPPADVDLAAVARDHHAFIAELDEAGLLVAHGAAKDERGRRWGTGLIVIRAADRAAAEAIARREPYIACGVRTLELMPWQVQLGRRTVAAAR